MPLEEEKGQRQSHRRGEGHVTKEAATEGLYLQDKDTQGFTENGRSWDRASKELPHHRCPAGSLILDLQAPEMWDDQFLQF